MSLRLILQARRRFGRWWCEAAEFTKDSGGRDGCRFELWDDRGSGDDACAADSTVDDVAAVAGAAAEPGGVEAAGAPVDGDGGDAAGSSGGESTTSAAAAAAAVPAAPAAPAAPAKVIVTCGTPGCNLADFHMGPCEGREVVGRRRQSSSAAALAAAPAAAPPQLPQLPQPLCDCKLPAVWWKARWWCVHDDAAARCSFEWSPPPPQAKDSQRAAAWPTAAAFGPAAAAVEGERRAEQGGEGGEGGEGGGHCASELLPSPPGAGV